MTIYEIHQITKILDLLGKKEHILFMSKDEYESEFDFIFTQYPKQILINSLTEGVKDKYLIDSLIIDGISFHILNTDIKK